MSHCNHNENKLFLSSYDQSTTGHQQKLQDCIMQSLHGSLGRHKGTEPTCRTSHITKTAIIKFVQYFTEIAEIKTYTEM